MGVVGACAAVDRSLPPFVDLDGPGVIQQCGDLAGSDPVVGVEPLGQSALAVGRVVTDDEQDSAGGDRADQAMLGIMSGGAAQRGVLRGDKVEPRVG